ncbi:MAG: twin-arginine translocase TatA/TatE family subunit [Chthoniobacterales bacterium]|nr:twin-arginine translocase TatA/TatE family subunit [Chthoniobacterales bacterium]
MSVLALLSNLGGPDLIIILLIILVLFGAKKLPELAKGMGQAVKEFQKAKDDFTDELHSAGKTSPGPEVRPAEASVARIPDAPTAREVPPAPRVATPEVDVATSREV